MAPYSAPKFASDGFKFAEFYTDVELERASHYVSPPASVSRIAPISYLCRKIALFAATYTGKISPIAMVVLGLALSGAGLAVSFAADVARPVGAAFAGITATLFFIGSTFMIQLAQCSASRLRAERAAAPARLLLAGAEVLCLTALSGATSLLLTPNDAPAPVAARIVLPLSVLTMLVPAVASVLAAATFTPSAARALPALLRDVLTLLPAIAGLVPVKAVVEHVAVVATVVGSVAVVVVVVAVAAFRAISKLPESVDADSVAIIDRRSGKRVLTMVGSAALVSAAVAGIHSFFAKSQFDIALAVISTAAVMTHAALFGAIAEVAGKTMAPFQIIHPLQLIAPVISIFAPGTSRLVSAIVIALSAASSAWLFVWSIGSLTQQLELSGIFRPDVTAEADVAELTRAGEA